MDFILGVVVGRGFGFLVYIVVAWPTCGLMYMGANGQTLDTLVGAVTLLLVRRYCDID